MPEKKKMTLAEEFAQDEAEMEAKKAAKQEKMAKGVAEAFIDGVEDGSVDLKTVPEKDIPSWYDAVKAKYDLWNGKLKQLEGRLPMMEAEEDTSRATPPPFFGKKGARSIEQIKAEAIHEMSDTSEREAKEKRGAERTAESFMDEIASGEIDLATIPEKDIPGYHAALQKKLGVWANAKKTLEGRIADFEEDLPEEKGPESMAA